MGGKFAHTAMEAGPWKLADFLNWVHNPFESGPWHSVPGLANAITIGRPTEATG
jgi:hypothetical protein